MDTSIAYRIVRKMPFHQFTGRRPRMPDRAATTQLVDFRKIKNYLALVCVEGMEAETRRTLGLGLGSQHREIIQFLARRLCTAYICLLNDLPLASMKSPPSLELKEKAKTMTQEQTQKTLTKVEKKQDILKKMVEQIFEEERETSNHLAQLLRRRS